MARRDAVVDEGKMKFKISGTESPSMVREFLVPQGKILEFIEFLMSAEAYVDFLGGLFVKDIEVEGVGTLLDNGASGGTYADLFQTIPKWGDGDSTKRGGYRVVVNLTANAASAVSEESQQQQRRGKEKHSVSPPDGGIVTVSRSYEIEAISMDVVAWNGAGKAGVPELRAAMYIPNILYTYRWAKIPPGTNLNQFDDILTRVNSKAYTLPIYQKKIKAGMLMVESIEDSVDFQIKDGKVEATPAMSITLRERVNTTFDTFFYMENKALKTENIPELVKLADFSKVINWK